jgi:hypothetical protein
MPNMKKYFTLLVSMTGLLVLLSFVLMWTGSKLFLPIVPLIPLYFGVVTGAQHYLTVQSAYKDPRIFVKNFLMLTVGVLLLHLLIIVVWAFTHVQTAKIFLLAFCICYIVYMVFETLALILFIKQQKKNN